MTETQIDELPREPLVEDQPGDDVRAALATDIVDLAELEHWLDSLDRRQKIDYRLPLDEALAAVGERSFQRLTPAERARIRFYGPAHRWIREAGVTDLFINGDDQPVLIVRGGVSESTELCPHPSWTQLLIQQLLLQSEALAPDALISSWGIRDGMVGERIRFVVTAPPATPDGHTVALRIKPTSALTLEDLIHHQVLTQGAAALLLEAVRHGVSVLVCGLMGSGKTTVLGALLLELSTQLRIIKVENPCELPPLPNSIRIDVSRSGLSYPACLRYALRQSGDLIVIGEILGSGEAKEFVETSASGHPNLATIHAAAPGTALRNLELLAGMSREASPEAIRGYIGTGAVPLLIAHVGRYGGRRRVGTIVEVLRSSTSGALGSAFPLNTLYAYDAQTDAVERTHYVINGEWARGLTI